MDRRHVLAGMAIAVAAPALAQPQTQTAPIPVAPSPAPTAGTATAGGQALGQAEQQWLQQTMMAGTASLQTSQIALEKAQDEDVKSFAKFESEEQKTIAEVLRSLMGPSAPQAPKLEGKQAEMVQKMQQMKAGAEFDKAYVQAQVEGHRELLQIQETLLNANPASREATNIAKLARGHIKEHIEVLEDYA